MKVLHVHFYHSPNGRHELIEWLIECPNVYPEDHDYFLNNDIKVSIEELSGEFIVYGCPEEDDSEESEVIVFAQGRSCEDTLAELALTCKATFGER